MYGDVRKDVGVFVESMKSVIIHEVEHEVVLLLVRLRVCAPRSLPVIRWLLLLHHCFVNSSGLGMLSFAIYNMNGVCAACIGKPIGTRVVNGDGRGETGNVLPARESGFMAGSNT